jgi:hypothetical protein
MKTLEAARLCKIDADRDLKDQSLDIDLRIANLELSIAAGKIEVLFLKQELECGRENSQSN